MALEPLYSLAVSCEIIPLSYSALTQILFKHKDKFPPRYHIEIDGAISPVRMLYESELVILREMVISNTRLGIHRTTSSRGHMGFLKAQRV